MLERLTLGDSLNFTTTVSGYSAASGWVLKYRLIPRASGTAIDITCTADGELHRATVAASTTAGWTAGTYTWASWVEKAGEKYSVANGSIQLLADPRTATSTYDLRTDAQIALDQAKAALKAWTPTTKRYSIAGREMEFNTPGDIIKVIQFWENEVAREANAAGMAAGLKNRRRIQVRLNRG